MAEAKTILKEPNKILRTKSRNISMAEIKSAPIRALILVMKETLAKTPDGAGLAAPQIGENLRIFIVSEEAEEIDLLIKAKKARGEIPEDIELKRGGRPWKYYVFINPVVRKTSSQKDEGTEGCLSVPGTFGYVKRNQKISVEAYDEYGKKFVRGESNFFARVIQHELDHLEGVLFIDKAKKLEYLKTNAPKQS